MEDYHGFGSTTWMSKLPNIDGLNSPLMVTDQQREFTDENGASGDLIDVDDEAELGIINFDDLDIDFDDLSIEKDVHVVKEQIEKSKEAAAVKKRQSDEQAKRMSASFDYANDLLLLPEINLTEEEEKELFMQAQTVLRLIKKKENILKSNFCKPFSKSVAESAAKNVCDSDVQNNECVPFRARSGTFTKDSNEDENIDSSGKVCDNDDETSKRTRTGTFGISDGIGEKCKPETFNRERSGTFVKDETAKDTCDGENKEKKLSLEVVKGLSNLQTPSGSRNKSSRLDVPKINIDFSPTHCPNLPKDAHGAVKFQGNSSPKTSPSVSPSNRSKGCQLRRGATFKKPTRPVFSKLQVPKVSTMALKTESKEMGSKDLSPNKRQRTSSVSSESSDVVCQAESVKSVCDGKRKLTLPKLRASYSSSNLPKARSGMTGNKHRRSLSNHSDTSDVSTESNYSSASSTSSVGNQSSRIQFFGNFGSKSSKVSGLAVSQLKNTTAKSSLKQPSLSRSSSMKSTVSASVKRSSPDTSNKKESSMLPSMISKLAMFKPSNLQRKVLTVNRNKQSKATSGPMKATENVKPSVQATSAAETNKEPQQKPSGLKRASTFTRGVKKPVIHVNPLPAPPKPIFNEDGRKSLPQEIESTPVQKEKSVQPKRIFSGNENRTPTKKKPEENSTGPGEKTPKRRSFLPTPTKSKPKRFEINDGCSNGSNSSMSSFNSPPLTVLPNPSVGVLIDLNLEDMSPSCMMSKGSRVVHTPLNRDKENECVVPSVWSPIPRARISTEDQAFICTKRIIPR